MHHSVNSSNVHKSQTMERAQMSIDRYMDKEDVGGVCVCVCVCMKNLAICNDMDGTRGYYYAY